MAFPLDINGNMPDEPDGYPVKCKDCLHWDECPVFPSIGYCTVHDRIGGEAWTTPDYGCDE